jgi:hypothetical protein
LFDKQAPLDTWVEDWCTLVVEYDEAELEQRRQPLLLTRLRKRAPSLTQRPSGYFPQELRLKTADAAPRQPRARKSFPSFRLRALSLGPSFQRPPPLRALRFRPMASASSADEVLCAPDATAAQGCRDFLNRKRHPLVGELRLNADVTHSPRERDS